jgi:dihydropteroate synthase-like protein
MNPTQHFHFVTGRLAESAVRSVVSDLSEKMGFAYSIDVLPITVAALMTGRWLLRHVQVPDQATKVVLPGYLQPDLDLIQSSFSVPVFCGPKNIQDLPQFFGKDTQRPDDYGAYEIQIIAEINHADRLSLDQLVLQARQLSQQGADTIDLGCSPGHRWQEIAAATAHLKQLGLRVSVDSFDPWEVAQACAAGAELVLSVNSSNSQVAAQWGCEVVAIPDSTDDLSSLYRTVEQLERDRVPYRVDPILEPIGLGFAASLERYLLCRRELPQAAMMMGIGNITELTDSDSAGINTLLLGFCQELRIGSVLTTQVINWARSSVRECDLARRLVHYSVEHQIPPKHLEPELVLLRAAKVNHLPADVLQEMAAAIRDPNYRLFISEGKIHAITAGLYVSGIDPFQIMHQIFESPSGQKLDASHAFYLGFEMCKALQALTLDKNYQQDEALQWGFLTRPEQHHRLKRRTDSKGTHESDPS